MGNKLSLLLQLGLIVTFCAPAFATIDKSRQRHKGVSAYDFEEPTLPPREIFERTRWLFQKLGVPVEPYDQDDLRSLDGLQSEAGLMKILPILDPHGQFRRFSSLQDDKDQSTLLSYQDFDSKLTEDFSVGLSSVEPAQEFLPLPSLTNAQKPLQGVRIALDPGHMGGDMWDERTGKYVTDHHGHKVSEGVINLQTALLLKAQLEALGATVFVTHEILGPVATVSWEDLQISDYAPRELAAETLDSWFMDLIQSAPPGDGLYNAFKNSPQVKRLYNEDMRWDYYVLNADLDARAQAIKKFNPHLTLIIHYDTDDPPDDPVGVNSYKHDFTKTYVPGGYEATEFATRRDRAQFAAHLLNPTAFSGSVRMAHEVLTSLESELDLKPDLGTAGEAVTIEPGVMARNLNLNRDLTNLTITFVECLFYNDPEEFQAFQAKDHEMKIGDTDTYYSNRLLQVVTGLRAGLLNYVKDARTTGSL